MIRKSVLSGATGFTFSVHPTNLEILRALTDAGELKPSFVLYPVLPYAAGYVRLVNEKGMNGLIKEVLSGISFSAKATTLLKGSFSAAAADPVGLLKACVDAELHKILRLGPAKFGAVLLHEIVTDLWLSFKTNDLFDSYMQHICRTYHVRPGFVTRNLVRLVQFFEGCGVSLEDVFIMTPLNRIGFQMNPSREACEACLSELRMGKVIAMSIMAGGYLSLDEAVEYLRTLPNVSGATVGVSSSEHAEHTFTKLRTLLHR